MLTNKACHRTALELAKVMLNIDPSDPCGVMLIVDVLALRAREHLWLVQAYEAWAVEKDASSLFNMQYSYPLALFHIAVKHKGGFYVSSTGKVTNFIIIPKNTILRPVNEIKIKICIR